MHVYVKGFIMPLKKMEINTLDGFVCIVVLSIMVFSHL